MQVVQTQTKTVTVSELEIGDVFDFDGTLFMKCMYSTFLELERLNVWQMDENDDVLRLLGEGSSPDMLSEYFTEYSVVELKHSALTVRPWMEGEPRRK